MRLRVPSVHEDAAESTAKLARVIRGGAAGAEALRPLHRGTDDLDVGDGVLVELAGALDCERRSERDGGRRERVSSSFGSRFGLGSSLEAGARAGADVAEGEV